MKPVYLLIFLFLVCFDCQISEQFPINATYVYFEENFEVGMIKVADIPNDSAYYYRLARNRSYAYGFRPKAKGQLILKEKFLKNEKYVIRDHNWIKMISKENPDSLSRDLNIMIVEDCGLNFKITPCSFFESIE